MSDVWVGVRRTGRGERADAPAEVLHDVAPEEDDDEGCGPVWWVFCCHESDSVVRGFPTHVCMYTSTHLTKVTQEIC